MQVDYSGWSKQFGSFHCEIFIDENKTDYEIHYQDGTIAKQSSPFQIETRDWNHDGDVYAQLGAWFSLYREDGSFSRGHFWTPEDMVRAIADAQDTTKTRYGNEVVAIPGIEIPPPGKRPSFSTRLRQTERRAEAQEIERNRKMKALGIRMPNEPWAR